MVVKRVHVKFIHSDEPQRSSSARYIPYKSPLLDPDLPESRPPGERKEGPPGMPPV